jgi:H+/Cl- antiporter ClcA
VSLVLLVVSTGSDPLVLTLFFGRGTRGLQLVLSGQVLGGFLLIAIFLILGKIVFVQLLFFLFLTVLLAVLLSIGSCGRGGLLLFLWWCFKTWSAGALWSHTFGVDDSQRKAMMMSTSKWKDYLR